MTLSTNGHYALSNRKELKAESPREKGYPDLIVHYENKVMIIEFERTRKTIKRFEDKLDGLRSCLESF